MKGRLGREAGDLLLLAAGAVPGALLRWRLTENLGSTAGGADGITVANLLGCGVLGLLLGRRGGSDRWMLAVGIGFCGSLTTFSSWMLQLADALGSGRTAAGASLLASGLAGGVAMVAIGHGIGHQIDRRFRRPRR